MRYSAWSSLIWSRFWWHPQRGSDWIDLINNNTIFNNLQIFWLATREGTVGPSCLFQCLGFSALVLKEKFSFWPYNTSRGPCVRKLFTGLIMYLLSQNKEHCIVLYCIVLYPLLTKMAEYLAYSAGVFIGCANVFALESAISTLPNLPLSCSIGTWIRFCPPKIRLHCRLLNISLVLLCVLNDLHFVSVDKIRKKNLALRENNVGVAQT